MTKKKGATIIEVPDNEKTPFEKWAENEPKLKGCYFKRRTTKDIEQLMAMTPDSEEDSNGI